MIPYHWLKSKFPRDWCNDGVFIILHSDLPHLQAPLKDFLSKEYSNVFLHRTEKREGLIRARLFGAEKARAKVLVFLDRLEL